ncbi:MAG: hypothetical protein N2202_08285, partial [Proteobacteria bacterium]|nr:hypothetical protein [Pseudomonadota bacterium]
MKAIGLLSGGLDSTLAIKLVKDQGIDVIALNFTSPFCTCTSKNSGCSSAVKSAKDLGIPLRVVSKGLDYFKIVENPKFGYGSNMNPCIDCRVYIFKKAKEIMEQEGASFLISGEVVGQRPMSQKRHTLRLIEKEAGVEDILLRPLSAKLLPPTLPERMGWVDREKLLAISGRGRGEQIRIAKESSIDYPCPAGGCLLTDKFIANRVRDLFKFKKEYTLEDIKLLKIGRHIRVSEDLKVIVGRDESECIKLQNAFNPDRDLIIYCVEPKGPALLVKDFKGVEIPEVVY